MVRGASFDNAARHPIDGASRFRFGDDLAACPANRQSAVRPIAAHTGQYDAKGPPAEGLHDRVHGHVYGRADIVHWRVLSQRHFALPIHDQVEAAGGQQGLTLQQAITGIGFFDRPCRDRVQVIGKGTGESGWHMLYDHCRRVQIGR